MRCCHSTHGLLLRGSAGVTRGGQQQFATQTLRVHLLGILVTRIAATSKSQIARDCNRNSKESLRLREHPLKSTLWTREPPVLCGFYSVSEAPHGSVETPQNPLRLQGCDAESQPNAIFVIATLRFYCDFCGKSLRLRSCDCQSLAICDCDCVGH